MAKRIPTNQRMLRILEVIGQSDYALSPTEMNAELGLPKQTIHRLVVTLVDEGYLIRDAEKNRFRPTRRLRMLGSGLLYASRTNILRHQILKQTADEIKETVNFVVPEEDGMRYIDRVETDWPFRIQLPRGSHVPFHITASGKTFLASLKPKMRRRFIEGLQLEKRTTRSHISAETLLPEINQIAKDGYAIDNEEFINGLVAVAVPVRDFQGRYVAALATHGPVERLKLSDKNQIASRLQHYADMLRDALFDVD